MAPWPLNRSTYPLRLSGHMWLLGLQAALLIRSGSLATIGSSASKPLYLSTQALWPHVAPWPLNCSTHPLRLSGHMWLLSLSAAAPLIHSHYLTPCGSLVSKPLYLSTQALWPHVAPQPPNLSTHLQRLSGHAHVAPQPFCCCSTYSLGLSDHMWLLGLQTALLIHSGSLATCGSSASELLYLSTQALWSHVTPQPLCCCSIYPLRLSVHM